MAVNQDRQTANERHTERKRKRRRGNSAGSHGPDDGIYKSLMDEAVREGWTEEQYEQALYDSDEFNTEFPGFFREDGSTAFSSAEEYRSAFEQYTHIASLYGQKVSKDQFSQLVYNSVDPGEFETRLAATDKMKTLATADPEGFKSFQQALKDSGYKVSTMGDLFAFSTKNLPSDVYDAYEAAQLTVGGLDINPKDALELSKFLGDSTGAADLSGAIEQIKALHPDIGPELKAAGLSDADLVKQLAGGIDPKGDISNRVRQLIAQRRALGKSRSDRSTGFSEVGTFKERNPGEYDLNNG